MRKIYCFPPISAPDAKILILGSMPGAASLAAGEYYAHPRNQFWPLMARLFGEEPGSYAEKKAMLLRHHIALWDVLRTCVRPGSLDSAITEEQVNDFKGFFEERPGIRTVCFNGGKAEQSFRKHVIPLIDKDKFTFYRLPSTSPAHAGRTFEEKHGEWAEILSGST